MRTTVYVAASYPRRTEARQLAEDLREAGFEITSRWLYAGEGYGLGVKADVDHTLPSQRDEEDVRCADVLVQLTGDTLTRGGRHSELGMAVILKKPVVLVGPREQVFHDHPTVRHVIDSMSGSASDVAELVINAVKSCVAGSPTGLVGQNICGASEPMSKNS